MKIELDIAQHQIEQLGLSDQQVVKLVEKEIARYAVNAAHSAWSQTMCECGHTRHWHAQEPPQPRGSGKCDDCGCEAFKARQAVAA